MSKTARVHPHTNERIEELKKALERDAGVTATQAEIIGALVYANTAAQLAGLLPVYKSYVARASDASD